MLKNIFIIGAGNIGSRHLQALAKVNIPLDIQVIDPSANSIALAKKRYAEVRTSNSKHKLNFFKDFEKVNHKADVAIIATTSNIRSIVTKKLLNKSKVKNIVFEKILFDNREAYEEMEKLLFTKKINAFVNCSRRIMPFYKGLKGNFSGKRIEYIVSGSQWNLASNSIHYIDHISYLTNCYDFEIDTGLLDSNLIQSNHKGFIELTGSLILRFKDGSTATLTSYDEGKAPQVMQIFSPNYRSLTLETENKSYISSSKNNWKWTLKKTLLLPQSQMTNLVVLSLLKSGSCELTPFSKSKILHLKLLESLVAFVNLHSETKYKYYPFT